MSNPLILKILDVSSRRERAELGADEALLEIVRAASDEQRRTVESDSDSDSDVLAALGVLAPVVDVLAGIEVQLRRTANALIKVPVKVTAEQALKAWPEHLRVGEEYVVQFLKDLGIEVDE